MDLHDNLRASLKPLVDAIAESFGVPDNHPHLTWEYSQSAGEVHPCVVVLVEASAAEKPPNQ